MSKELSVRAQRVVALSIEISNMKTKEFQILPKKMEDSKVAQLDRMIDELEDLIRDM